MVARKAGKTKAEQRGEIVHNCHKFLHDKAEARSHTRLIGGKPRQDMHAHQALEAGENQLRGALESAGADADIASWRGVAGEL